MASYSYDFKIEALALSDVIGPQSAAEKMGVPYGTLLKWRRSRNRPKLEAYAESIKKQEDIASFKNEISELKRTNAILLETIRNLSAAQAQ